MAALATALLFLSPVVARNVVRERARRSKQIQLLSQLSPCTYWLSHFFFDLFLMWLTLALLCTMLFGLLTDDSMWLRQDVWLAVVLCCTLFVPASLALANFSSFFFMYSSQSESAALGICVITVHVMKCVIYTVFVHSGVTFMLNLLVSSVGTGVVYALTELFKQHESGLLVVDIFEWLLRLHPAYCLGHGLFSLLLSVVGNSSASCLLQDPLILGDSGIWGSDIRHRKDGP
jgi:uncharacterized membrane protein YqaE (UPF0057 family)